MVCHSLCFNLWYDIAEAVTGFSKWRTRLNPMVEHMGVAVDEVKFRQVSYNHLGFPLPMLHTHL
jgi:hypothetical protein